MTKNKASADRQTIRVLSPDGQAAGSTYPKRAGGLVKKGRACYVNDFTIRLNMSDAALNSEVIKMDNRNHNIETGREQSGDKRIKLYFDARSWRFNKDCKKVGERSFMQGPLGELVEAYMIGNWSHDWTEIVSETLLLPKYADCSFTFWLNGGENDRNDEVCRFEVVLNNDYDQRYTYNLNRNYIRPLKKLNGWELYEIPFHTRDNEYTQLRFVAQRAYMTVTAAQDASTYAHLADTPDPFEDERPQRHNLIFADGFPKNSWYSTEQLSAKRREREQKQKSFENAGKTEFNQIPPLPPVFGAAAGTFPAQALPAFPTADSTCRAQLEQIQRKMDSITAAREDIEKFDVDSFVKQLRQTLEDAFADSGEKPDLDDLINDTVESVTDTLNDASEAIQDALEEVSDQIEELKDSLEQDED